jgi:Mg2+/Co2+ transporter CorB
MLLLTLVVIVGLLVLAAVFCAAETAMLSASKARLYQKAREGNQRAAQVLELLKQPEQLLATILIILTLVPVISSALTAGVLDSHFGALGITLATILLAIAILLFGEAFPKALGTRYPEQLALGLGPLVGKTVKFLFPITAAIRLVNSTLLRLIGLGHKGQPAYTEADVRGAINLGLEHGTLAPSQHQMLDAVLDLNAFTLKDIMVHRSAMIGLDLHTPPSDLPRTLGGLAHSRVLVWEGSSETLVGILSVRDYLGALAQVASRHDVNLRGHLQPLYYVPETTPIGHQLRQFLLLKKHLALVVDEFGDVQGLVTLEDILEEIVGEIADEHEAKRGKPVAETVAEGGWVLGGNTAVRDANRLYGWQLPDDSAVTIAGLMIEHLGHLPVQGESCTLAGLTLTVQAKRGHRLERVTVKVA